jgi:hypothetical protein
MVALVQRSEIINLVGQETRWMVEQRMQKLREELHDTMSLSPFLMPILYDLHNAGNFSELAELLLAGHLMIGHFTSFGKLIDEKILPRVFNTHKLNAAYRRSHPPLIEACFDEIDHLVPRPGGKPALLSMKSSRWTIQLTAAIGLNRAFAEILRLYSHRYEEIVVGVTSGTQARLSDKYDILRGINRGKAHNVIDLQSNVKVLAGREFWSWINGNEPATQDWIMDGILVGLRTANCRNEIRQLLAGYTAAFNRKYDRHLNAGGTVDWHQLLTEING